MINKGWTIENPFKLNFPSTNVQHIFHKFSIDFTGMVDWMFKHVDLLLESSSIIGNICC